MATTNPPGKTPAAPTSARRHAGVHPILMLLGVLLLCAVLTWVLGSGAYQRVGDKVIAGTYAPIPKPVTWSQLLASHASAGQASPASMVAVLRSIPLGLAKFAPLIFMVMIVGGMFGVFKRTGALDAGLDHLVRRTRGSIYVLAPVLMCALAAGSAFLGLVSEYLAILPAVMLLGERLKLNPLYAVAMVLVAAKLGYVASVSNPVVLPIAQGIVGVPIFSGSGMRLAVLAVFVPLGMLYLLYRIRQSGFADLTLEAQGGALARRHAGVLWLLGLAVVLMVYGGHAWNWHFNEFSTFYLSVTVVIAVAGGAGARASADAFVDGIKGMILPSLLIGLAGAIQVLLLESQVLDTVVHGMANVIAGHSPWVSSLGIMFTEAGLDVLIPSTSAKAAISTPILWPIGQLAGLQGNSVVLAFLFGNGLMATVSPTSGLLLAMLAIAKVPYGRWVRFMLPLTLVLTVLAVAFLRIATQGGH